MPKIRIRKFQEHQGRFLKAYYFLLFYCDSFHRMFRFDVPKMDIPIFTKYIAKQEIKPADKP